MALFKRNSKYECEDPSQKALTQLVKEINEKNVKYILYEDNVANKVTETIRKETNAKPLKFYNMESLNKEQSKDESMDYQTLMNKNIEALDKALDSNIKVEDEKANINMTKLFQMAILKIIKLKIVRYQIMKVNGNQFIPI